MSLTDHGGDEGHQYVVSLVPSMACNADLVLNTFQLENLVKSTSSIDSLRAFARHFCVHHGCRCNAKNVLQQGRDRHNFLLW